MAIAELTGQVEHADTDSDQSAVSVTGLSKTFRSRHGVVKALDNLSIDVAPGEIVVLLGPSGCGKSTLLRSIAGLEMPDEGQIVVSGRTVFSGHERISVQPEARHLSMVFQSYALWPHLTINDNVSYPLQMQSVARKQIRPRVERALQTVGCGHLGDRFPHQISGGQQQRVALARAIIAHRGLILFDEPLSNVDAKVRERLRLELLSLQRALGFAAVYVTHDQTEAMIMATRIAVMDKGQIVQIGTPTNIYDEPASHYVADFIGAATFLDGVVTEAMRDEVLVRTDVGIARVAKPGQTYREGQSVTVFFRPEHCRLSLSGSAGPNFWRAAVEASLYLGPNYEYVLRAGGHRLLAWAARAANLTQGSDVWVDVSPEHVRILPRPTVASAGAA